MRLDRQHVWQVDGRGITVDICSFCHLIYRVSATRNFVAIYIFFFVLFGNQQRQQQKHNNNSNSYVNNYKTSQALSLPLSLSLSRSLAEKHKITNMSWFALLPPSLPLSLSLSPSLHVSFLLRCQLLSWGINSSVFIYFYYDYFVVVQLSCSPSISLTHPVVCVLFFLKDFKVFFPFVLFLLCCDLLSPCLWLHSYF